MSNSGYVSHCLLLLNVTTKVLLHKKIPKYHLESKHIEINFHYICEKTLGGQLKLKYYNNEK